MIAMTANLGNIQVWSINVTNGVGTLLTTVAGVNNHGITYDPVIDRFWQLDYDGNLFQYEPTTFVRTPITSGQGAHTCAAYVP
jgi:hypothetical protein